MVPSYSSAVRIKFTNPVPSSGSSAATLARAALRSAALSFAGRSFVWLVPRSISMPILTVPVCVLPPTATSTVAVTSAVAA